MIADLKIQYKWLSSEGLNLIWEDKPIKPTSVYKARKIDKVSAQKLGYKQSPDNSLSELDTQQAAAEQVLKCP